MAESEHELRNMPSSLPSSSHRLPTISGTQALQNLDKDAKGIRTNIQRLDRSLLPAGAPQSAAGIQRGSVTEIYGPPGSGKTTFAMQLVVNALNNASHVTWIATGSPLILERLKSLIRASSRLNAETIANPPDEAVAMQEANNHKIEYTDASSLPRLLALFLHPNEEFPATKTSLIVVDDLSNLLFGSLTQPRRSATTTTTSTKDRHSQRAINRRYRVIGSLSSALAKFAAIRDIPIVVINNTTIAFKNGQRAILKPALSGKAWDAGISTRIMLYRDFWPAKEKIQATSAEYRGYRLAKVVRLGGREFHAEGVPFTITEDGICEIIKTPGTLNDRDGLLLLPKNTASLPPLTFNERSQIPSVSEIRSAKRKAAELADSEGEEEGLRGQTNGEETLQPILTISDEEADEAEGQEDEDEILLLDEHEKLEAESRLASKLS